MLTYNTSTTSKRSLWPPEHSDKWVVGAWGSTLRLSNGENYDDWGSALGAITLGYDAFSDHLMHFTPAATLPWNIEQQYAQEFCTAMGTESVRFFKSGSDAVSCAVRLARAYTGKPNVVVFKECYHGTGDWHGPNLWTRRGIVDEGHCIRLPFGATQFYPHSVGAVVLEPVPKSTKMPPEGWLSYVRDWCDERGALLISDEIILGFRHSLPGYLDSVNTRADLLCYGKAMGQGAAVSACTGPQKVLGLLQSDVHFSGTNNGAPVDLYIAQQTLRRYVEGDVCTQLSNKGALLRYLLHEAGFYTRGLDERFEVEFMDAEDRMSATRALWDCGVLFPGFISISLAHTRAQMERLIEGLKKWRG